MPKLRLVKKKAVNILDPGKDLIVLQFFCSFGENQYSGGEEAIQLLLDQLYSLCWSFAVVGVVSLLAGSSYVSIWTWTGESQALRYVPERHPLSIFFRFAFLLLYRLMVLT